MKNEIVYKKDAIEVVCDNCPISFKDKCEWKDNGHCSMKVALEILPSADVVSREDYHNLLMATNDIDRALREYQAKDENSSAEAKLKWTCTANFVAEQLERLKDMADEERIKLLQTMFPSAEAVQGWIPCSERLPSEKDGRVLVTKRDEVMIAIYSEFSDRWYLDDMCAVGNEGPIAWMPLPQPYKGGDLE